MRNSLPWSLSYVQTQLEALPGVMGVAVEGGKGVLPGDDQYHGISLFSSSGPLLQADKE